MLSLAPDRENAHFSENSCYHLRTGKLLIEGSRPRKLESELTKLPKPIRLGGGTGDNPAEHPSREEQEGYRMVSFNLKVLAKSGLCSNCSQKLHGCSLARARKIFATARMLAFSLTCARLLEI